MMYWAGHSQQVMYNTTLFGWLYPIIVVFILVIVIVVLILLAIYLYMKINEISNNKSKK